MSNLFGAKLRYLRRYYRLTQTELVSRLGIESQSQISNIEAGRRTPSLDLVLRIAALFGVSADYLLRDELRVTIHDAGSLATAEVPQAFQGEQFGRALRQLRVQYGLTQAQLAQQLGLSSHTHISHLEVGRHEPSLDLVIRIANLFAISIDQLLRNNESREARRLT